MLNETISRYKGVSMALFMWNVLEKITYKYRNQIGVCLQWGQGYEVIQMSQRDVLRVAQRFPNCFVVIVE